MIDLSVDLLVGSYKEISTYMKEMNKLFKAQVTNTKYSKGPLCLTDLDIKAPSRSLKMALTNDE